MARKASAGPTSCIGALFYLLFFLVLLLPLWVLVAAVWLVLLPFRLLFIWIGFLKWLF